MREKEESTKKIITRNSIVADLKTESLHLLLIFGILAALSLVFFAFIITASQIYSWKYEILIILIFAAPPAFFAIQSAVQIAALAIYSSNKLLIVEDTLYQTIPYEKLNRAHSSKYTKWYNHGLYFKQYGKYTLVSPDFSIDFDGTKEYYLVILNLKKPKIISYYRKDAYEIQN